MRQSKAHAAADYRTMVLYLGIALATLAAPIVLWRLSYPFIRLMDAVYHPIPLLQLLGVYGYTLSTNSSPILLLSG